VYIRQLAIQLRSALTAVQNKSAETHQVPLSLPLPSMMLPTRPLPTIPHTPLTAPLTAASIPRRARQVISSWQFANSLKLWARVISAYPADSQLGALVYPLVQVLPHTNGSNAPTARTHPTASPSLGPQRRPQRRDPRAAP
jgi:hypothetical protein